MCYPADAPLTSRSVSLRRGDGDGLTSAIVGASPLSPRGAASSPRATIRPWFFALHARRGGRRHFFHTKNQDPTRRTARDDAGLKHLVAQLSFGQQRRLSGSTPRPTQNFFATRRPSGHVVFSRARPHEAGRSVPKAISGRPHRHRLSRLRAALHPDCGLRERAGRARQHARSLPRRGELSSFRGYNWDIRCAARLSFWRPPGDQIQRDPEKLEALIPTRATSPSARPFVA